MGKAERILFILRQFNKQGKLTVNELAVIFDNEGIEVEKKSIQRDLKLLHEQGLISFYNKHGNMKVWELVKAIKTTFPSVQLLKDDINSYHILKAYLKNFKNTPIEEGIIQLEKKLEKLAPGDAFASESFFWDKNFGHYDYTQHDITIRRIIRFISENKWMKVQYNTAAEGDIKEFNCYPRKMFVFKGSLYVVAFTTGKKDEHRALLIQNIEDIQEIQNPQIKVPAFDFQKWSKNRFGVYYSKPMKVRLLINESYVKYFKNRSWHTSQVETIDDQGNFILEMTVPIVPDFISWIISWGKGIKVLEPKELQEKIITEITDVLKQYD